MRCITSNPDGSYVLTREDGEQLTLPAGTTLQQLDAAIAEFMPQAPKYTVRKSLVVKRLIAADLIEAAMTAIMANSAAFARWTAPDWPEVYNDDPEALALLAQIGADPAVILAPPAA